MEFQGLGNKVTTLDFGGFNVLRVTRHGPMLYNKNDVYVGGSLMRYGEFSPGEWKLFQMLTGSGMTVVEVGANIGAHTVPLAKRVGQTGRVIAFEPQRLCFQLLCANVALNQLTNVEAWPYACGASYGQDTVPVLQPPPDQPFNFGGLPMGTGPADGTYAIERMPIVRLDDVGATGLALGRVGFLKIDVEGMESEVLRGAAQLIPDDRPVLYVENDRHEKSEELVRLIRSMGYDLYWHLPPLFEPDNFAGNNTNAWPGVVSINMLCMQAGVRPPIPLAPVARHDEVWNP
jgi:FkbM family methyltransferase